MKLKKPLVFLLLALIVFGSFSFVISANDPATLMSYYEWEYLRLLNNERVDKGLLPLSTFDALNNASRTRAKELGKQFNHYRPNGGQFWETVLRENIITYNGSVETNIYGNYEYDDIFKTFCANKEQYSNLTRKFFRHSSEAFNTDPDNDFKVTFNNILIGGCEFKKIRLLGYGGNRMHLKVGGSLSDEQYVLVCECSHGTSYMPIAENMVEMASDKAGKQTAVIKYGDSLRATVNLYVDFTDVDQGSWYYAGVTSAYDKGLFSGTSSKEFSPEAPLTRAMFVTALARVVDFDTSVYGKSTFDDVGEDAWYSSAVAWAADKGIISGVGNNEFKPNEPITREQICTILSKFAASLSVALPYEYQDKTFADADSISEWAAASVTACQRAGIVGGDTDDNFNPGSGAKRCEAAIMLVRFSNIIAG
ncbi:MAG: S-layer homology domain-containing protein [Clostridia bacterium]|nr:S-layer homology domain-containing protein [Clostridia bacterium]